MFQNLVFIIVFVRIIKFLQLWLPFNLEKSNFNQEYKGFNMWRFVYRFLFIICQSIHLSLNNFHIVIIKHCFFYSNYLFKIPTCWGSITSYIDNITLLQKYLNPCLLMKQHILHGSTCLYCRTTRWTFRPPSWSREPVNTACTSWTGSLMRRSSTQTSAGAGGSLFYLYANNISPRKFTQLSVEL